MSYTNVQCEDCDWTGLYSLTHNGEIPDPCPDCGGDLSVSDAENKKEPEVSVHKRYDEDKNVIYVGQCAECGVEHRETTPTDAEYAAKGCCQ